MFFFDDSKKNQKNEAQGAYGETAFLYFFLISDFIDTALLNKISKSTPPKNNCEL